MTRPGLPHFRAGVIDDPTLARCIAQTHRLLESPDVSAIEKETRLLQLLTLWISDMQTSVANGQNAGVSTGP